MQNLSQKIGKTITFYSYKGGVGRSMALINVACLLAKSGKKVLMIDWDLEAPGLHTYFNGEVKKSDLGLVDLILDSKEFLKIDENNTQDKVSKYFEDNLSRFIKSNLVLKEQKKLKQKDFTLDLLKAGNFDKNYTTKLSSINWMEFYSRTPEYFRTLANHLEKKYDYILVDSRTGLADTSGVCTMLMPSILVLVFVLNQQNIDGVIKVCEQALEYRFSSHDERNLNILPLPSRIDNGNSKNYQHWENIYKKEFENLFKKIFNLEECNLRNYFDIAQVKYDADNSYGENIPVLTENLNNRNFISYDYNEFTNILDRDIPIWEYLSETEIKEIESKIDLLTKQENFKESLELMEIIYPFKNEDHDFLSTYSYTLIEFSKEISDNEMKSNLFKKAYDLSLKSTELSNLGFYNLACSLSLLDKKEESISILFSLFEKEVSYTSEYLIKLILKDLSYDFINIKDESKFIELRNKYNIYPEANQSESF